MKNIFEKTIFSGGLILALSLTGFSIANAEEEHTSWTPEEFEEQQEKGHWPENTAYEEYLDFHEQNEEALERLKNDEVSTESESAISSDNYTPRAGDILTTNDISKDGFTGHNGIVSTNGTIIHAPGYDEPVTEYTWSQWQNRYSTNRVDRPNIVGHGISSGEYSEDIFDASPIYEITSVLNTVNSTYCSKLVSQSYYNAGHAETIQSGNYIGFMPPFELIDYITALTHVLFNELEKVSTKEVGCPLYGTPSKCFSIP